MAYDYPGSCAPSRWLPSAPKQKLERGPFGLAHRVPRASPMRAASGCLPPAVRIIPQYVPGLQPRFGACCQSRAIYYQQKRGFPRHEKTRKRLVADSLTQPAETAHGRACQYKGTLGTYGTLGTEWRGTIRWNVSCRFVSGESRVRVRRCAEARRVRHVSKVKRLKG